MRTFNTKYLEGLKDPHKAKIFKTFAAVETKLAQDGSRTLIVKISTPTPDRSKDTVQPGGMIYDNYLKNPVVLFAHKYDTKPIAKCIDLQVTDAGVIATIQFPDEGVYPEADTIYQLCLGGFLNAWSIGFMPDDYELNEFGGYDFKSWEMFEFSSVPVPDNPEALTIMRSKGIDVDLVVGQGEEAPEVIEEVPTDVTPAEEAIKDEAKALDDAARETVEKGTTENEVKTLVQFKDVDEVIALSYVLDCLDYFIDYFTSQGINEEDIAKLSQALALVLEVTQSQAELGKKEFRMKAGRTISAKHEGLLKEAMEHMTKSVEGVKTVLDSVSEEAETNDEDTESGKGTQPVEQKSSLTYLMKEMLIHQTKSDKQQGLALKTSHLLLQALKEKGGE